VASIASESQPVSTPSRAERIGAGAACAALVAAAAVLWLVYAPGHSATGAALSALCYAGAGIAFIVTAAHPLAGLILLAFSAPLLNGWPLYLVGGPYPVVVFSGAGFIAGWLAREAVQPSGWRPFRGQVWLAAFVAVAVLGAATSFLRYYPVWMWDLPAFRTQPVTTTGMQRLDASRHVVFSLVNVVFFGLMVTAAHGVLRRQTARVTAGRLVLGALVLGTLGAGAVALYQALGDTQFTPFCSNKSYYWIRLTRANGTCSDPNAFGTLTGLCFVISMLLVVFAGPGAALGSWFRRALASVAAVVLVFSLQYSGSRSGLLAVLLALFCAGTIGLAYYSDRLLHRFHTPMIVRALVATAVILACATIVLSVPAVIRYVDSHTSVTQSSSSLLRRFKRDCRLFQQQGKVTDMVTGDTRRNTYWQYGRQFLRSFPVSGIGLGSYVIELPNATTIDNVRLFRTDNACNYYLHYGAETGLTGLAFIILFYGVLLGSLAWSLRHWSSLGSDTLHHRLLLGMATAIFLLVLCFGVHTLADEVCTAFAIVLGLVAAEVGAAPVRPPLRFRIGMAAVVVGVLALFTWRSAANSRGSLSGDQRLASAGIKAEAGWFDWENWPGQPFRVRWMGRNAETVMPRSNLELGVPIMSGSAASAEQPQRVSFWLNGRLVRTHTFEKPGEWALIRLPVCYATPFRHTVQPHTALRIEAVPTWIPQTTTGAEDVRTLGVLVGEFRWSEPEGAEGGWHAAEHLADKTPFNWSTDYAWRKIPVTATNSISISLYASHLLLRRWPLEVAIYLNRQLLGTVSLCEKRWDRRTYKLPASVAVGSTALIEFAVSRTWVPRHYGFDDSRSLGVAVGEIRCE